MALPVQTVTPGQNRTNLELQSSQVVDMGTKVFSYDPLGSPVMRVITGSACFEGVSFAFFRDDVLSVIEARAKQGRLPAEYLPSLDDAPAGRVTQPSGTRRATHRLAFR